MKRCLRCLAPSTITFGLRCNHRVHRGSNEPAAAVGPSQRHKDGERNKAFTKGGLCTGHPLDCITLEAIIGLLGQPSSIAALQQPHVPAEWGGACALHPVHHTTPAAALHLCYAPISHIRLTTPPHSSGSNSDLFWFPQRISAQHLKLKDSRRYCQITHKLEGKLKIKVALNSYNKAWNLGGYG